ncbi:MAG: hypothetical protein P9L88_07460 [Candidatus Tantalella remota]|nr:hypothetical protein [Candidatus Tantalella remota]
MFDVKKSNQIVESVLSKSDEIEQKILSPYATRSNDAIRKIKEKTDIRQNFAHRFSGKAGSNGNIDKLFQGLTGY